MPIARYNTTLLNQFAKQGRLVPEAQRNTVSASLPLEETPDFLHGLLAGLASGYALTNDPTLGLAVALVSERIQLLFITLLRAGQGDPSFCPVLFVFQARPQVSLPLLLAPTGPFSNHCQTH